MNSSVWAVWAAQGSKEKKSGFEFFWATFEGGFFNFLKAKKKKDWKDWKDCSVRPKKLHKIKLKKNLKNS